MNNITLRYHHASSFLISPTAENLQPSSFHDLGLTIPFYFFIASAKLFPSTFPTPHLSRLGLRILSIEIVETIGSFGSFFSGSEIRVRFFNDCSIGFGLIGSFEWRKERGNVVRNLITRLERSGRRNKNTLCEIGQTV